MITREKLNKIVNLTSEKKLLWDGLISQSYAGTVLQLTKGTSTSGVGNISNVYKLYLTRPSSNNPELIYADSQDLAVLLDLIEDNQLDPYNEFDEFIKHFDE